MTWTRTAILAAVAGVVLLVGPRYLPSIPLPVPGKSDAVSEAFDLYESMWRVSAQRAADKLEDGELSTDVAVRDYLSEQGQIARRRAFDAIARREAELLQPWTAEAHVAILRGYAE